MVNLSKQTKPLSENSIKREWHLIDVKGKVLGRVVPQIVRYLTGKHKTSYVPYLDTGDNVVVVNASQVKLTGKKDVTKIYTNYSGYPSGLRRVPITTLFKTKPQEIIRHAVSGMLPKNKLRDRRLTRLFVFPSEKHNLESKFKK